MTIYHESLMAVRFTVDEKSPRRVMKTCVQSQRKVISHASPKKTKFHSRITMTGSSSFQEFSSRSAQMPQQTAMPTRQPAKKILSLLLCLVIAEESHSWMSLTTRVMVTASRKSMMKKKMAPMSWMMGYPFPSIVPMAARKPRVETCPIGSIQLQMDPGYSVSFLTCSSHLKMLKQTRLMNPPAGSMRYLKAMSCGQWQAVLVMVACGKGGSSFFLTASWQVSTQAQMSRGMKKQSRQLMCMPPNW